jgi:outer membrane protein assembly factor BamB
MSHVDKPVEQSSTKRSPPRQLSRRLGRWILSILPLLCLIMIVPVRYSAEAADFAVANVLSLLLTGLAWLSLVAALAVSHAPRYVWKLLLFIPVVGMLLLFALYKLERLDGDLVPQFRARWGARKALPMLKNELPGQAGPTPAELLLFAPRSTDYPQYLGPTRDARLLSTQLATDWSDTAPQLQWKQAIGEGWSSFAIQGDVAITMEQRADEEWVAAYSVRDGSLLWHYAMPGKHTNLLGGTGPRSTPTIFDNSVYACSAVSRLVCLELTTGREVWSRELLQLAGTTQAEFESRVSWGRSASPLVTEQQVIVPLGGTGPRAATVLALERATGNELWRSGTDQISYSSPILAEVQGQAQILLISENLLAAFAPADGHQLWSFPWPGSSTGAATVSQPGVVDASRILLSKGYGEGAELLRIELLADQWQVLSEWKKPSSLRTKFTNAVIHNGFAYGLSDGILECVALEDGRRQWKQGRYRQGQLLLVGEMLLITAESGQLVLVKADPDNFQELANLAVIGDVTWNPPALSGDRLLMRNSNEAACVILPLVPSDKH